MRGLMSVSATTKSSGLLEQLSEGPVICAEGYLFELERRGYLQAGAFVPEAVLDHPNVVRQLHRDFVHAGSDVVEAFTYYGHREKLRIIGKEDLLEDLNRQALVIAAEVVAESGKLLAGNICNTTLFEPGNSESEAQVRSMFEEQVTWAVEANADFIIGETFDYTAEALIALDVIKQTKLPAVITMAIHRAPETREGHTAGVACNLLADAGADVVGLNCSRGPWTMLPLLAEICQSVDCHVAALPVPYRTHDDEPTFQSLRDPNCGCLPDEMPFPTALDPFTCNRFEISDFTTKARDLGASYLGVCCGGGPHHVRAIAEALGRTPPASRYSPDMSKHTFYGTDAKLHQHYTGAKHLL